MEPVGTVSPSESLARYLTSSTHYSREKHLVKPAAFLPPPPDWRLSVFRIDGLSVEEVCGIGRKVIGKTSERTLHGFADIKARVFHDLKLTIDPDNDPPRHASVLGWPEDKSSRKLIAIELAASATLVFCPP